MNAPTVRSEASRAAATSIVIKAIRLGFAVATSVYIRRTLGPELVGHYGVAQFAAELVGAVASFGMGHVLLRFLPPARLSREPGAPARVLRVALVGSLLGWALVAACVAAGRPAIATWVRGDTVYGLIRLGVLLLVARLAFDVLLQAHHALLNLRRVPAITLAWQIAFLTGLWVAFRAGWGVEGVLWAGAVSNALGAGALAWALRGRLTPTGSEDTSVLPLGRLLRYGVPFAGINLLYNIVWRHSETVLLNYHWGASTAGQFFVAYSLPQQILEFVPTAIWPVVMASFATVFATDRARAVHLVTTYYKLLFLLVIPLAVGGAILGDRALIVLNGVAYAPGASLSRWFFVVQLIGFLGTPLGMLLYVLEKPLKNLAVWAGAAVVNVGLNVILIPIDWRLGCVLPVTVAVVGMPIVLMALVRREGIAVAIPGTFFFRVLAGSGLLVLLLPVRSWVSGPVTLVVAAIVAAALVGVGFRVTRLFRGEESRLLDYLPEPWGGRARGWLGGGA